MALKQQLIYGKEVTQNFKLNANLLFLHSLINYNNSSVNVLNNKKLGGIQYENEYLQYVI